MVPVALAAGLSVAFVVAGVGIAAAGPAIGLDADRMVQIGADRDDRALAWSSWCRR